jgi:predicted flap endonuclease-1-like 5' DNA nuclease
MNSPCIIIPVVVGLICALFGYLLGKTLSSGKNNSSALQLELDNCKAKSSKLEAELTILKAKSSNFVAPHAVNSGLIGAYVPFDADLASSAFGQKVKENDLKIIEGIGPKIEELFNANGILTWEVLSETSVDRCQEILDKAGKQFIVHDPKTWPHQSKLAFEGKWKKLKDWQNAHIGGKK